MSEIRDWSYEDLVPVPDLDQDEFRFIRHGSGCHFCESCAPHSSFLEEPPEPTLERWERFGAPDSSFAEYDEQLERLFYEEPGEGVVFGQAKSGHYIFMCRPHFERANLLDQLVQGTVTLGLSARKKFVDAWVERSALSQSEVISFDDFLRFTADRGDEAAA